MNLEPIHLPQHNERDAKSLSARGVANQDRLSRLPAELFQSILEFVHPHSGLHSCRAWNRHYFVLSQTLIGIPKPLRSCPTTIAKYDHPEFRRHFFERENKNAEYEMNASDGEFSERIPKEPQLGPSTTSLETFKEDRLNRGLCGKVMLQGTEYSTSLFLINCETGTALRHIPLVSSVLSISERRFVTASDNDYGELTLWDVNQPKPLHKKGLRDVRRISRIYNIGHFILIAGWKEAATNYVKCFALREDGDIKGQVELEETAHLEYKPKDGDGGWQVRIVKKCLFTVSSNRVHCYVVKEDGALKKLWGLCLYQEPDAKCRFLEGVNKIGAINPQSVAVAESHVAIQCTGMQRPVYILDANNGKLVGVHARRPLFKQMWIRENYLIGLQEEEYSFLNASNIENRISLLRSQIKPWTLHLSRIGSRKFFYVADFDRLSELPYPAPMTKQLWVLGQQLVICTQLDRGSTKEQLVRLNLAEQEVKERRPERPAPQSMAVVVPINREAERKRIVENRPHSIREKVIDAAQWIVRDQASRVDMFVSGLMRISLLWPTATFFVSKVIDRRSVALV